MTRDTLRDSSQSVRIVKLQLRYGGRPADRPTARYKDVFAAAVCQLASRGESRLLTVANTGRCLGVEITGNG
jgi:hypothetical protein